MTTLALALQKAIPDFKPEETFKTYGRKIAYWLDRARATRKAKYVKGADRVVRRIAGIIFPEEAQEAISWARGRVNAVDDDGKPVCDAFVLCILATDENSRAYEVLARKESGIRVKHLAVRLRKEECRAQGVNLKEIRKETFRVLLAQTGQPDHKGMRNWFWDSEKSGIRSLGTPRLTFEEVFTTVANAVTESLGVFSNK